MGKLDLLSNGRVDFAAGRGYDRREYAPLGVSFDDNQSIFEEGMEVVRRLWSEDKPISHRGQHYAFEHVAITPRPVQRPIPALCRIVLPPVDRIGGTLGLRPDRGAIRRGDDIRRPRTGARALPRQLREAWHTAGSTDVQLLHAFRRRRCAGTVGARAADPLLQGVRHPRVSRRSADGTTELSLLLRYGRSAAQRAPAGPDGEFGTFRVPRHT